MLVISTITLGYVNNAILGSYSQLFSSKQPKLTHVSLNILKLCTKKANTHCKNVANVPIGS